MILIEVNNQNAESNSELIAQTQTWIAANMPEIGNDYCIVLNPKLQADLKISRYEPRESNNAPLGTNGQTEHIDSDNTTQNS